ncbi:MAG: hypothetical protein Q8Q12_22075 [bacterium]|nr:hypothetical protein [bacterium]
MKAKKGDKHVTITGTVIPTDWDKDGKVAEVALSTPAEDEYTVTNNLLGQELLQFVGARVVATGTVTEDEHWSRRITLNSYETLEDDEQGEEGEYLDDEEEYYDEEQFDGKKLFEAQEEW